MSCSSLFLIMSTAHSTGTDVNKAVTSCEVIHYPSSSVMFLICSTNSLVLLTW